MFLAPVKKVQSSISAPAQNMCCFSLPIMARVAQWHLQEWWFLNHSPTDNDRGQHASECAPMSPGAPAVRHKWLPPTPCSVCLSVPLHCSSSSFLSVLHLGWYLELVLCYSFIYAGALGSPRLLFHCCISSCC